MPKPKKDQPPTWFMPHWLNPDSWFWDAKRGRFIIRLDFHFVQVVERKGRGWTWRAERVDAPGMVSTGGFGCAHAMYARRACLAELWSDLWTGGGQHERLRLSRRPSEDIDGRLVRACEIEANLEMERRNGGTRRTEA